MKIVVDLEDIKNFGSTLDEFKDEWYGPVNCMTLNCIREFFEWNGNTKAAAELDNYIKELS